MMHCSRRGARANRSSKSSNMSTTLPHHTIIPLDFTNLILTQSNKLPHTHTWPHRSYDSPDPSHHPVPVIDLSAPRAVHLIRHACDKFGAFQVTGHGVPVQLLKEVEAEARRLFSLPMGRKILALRSPENMAGYGTAPVSLLCPKGLWSEGFTIAGSVAEHATKLWPAHDESSRFCSVIGEYKKQMELVTKKIITLILTSLGLTNDDVPWMKAEKEAVSEAAVVQLNSYPVCPDPAQAMGMAPHTDSSMVTVLYQGNVAGLQLQSEKGRWVTVPPTEGALVVNLGDLMHILSNGRFRSVLHRALVNGSEHRISVAYFYGSPKGVEVKPAVNLVGEGTSPMYGPVTWKDYLGLKGRHGQKALEMIKTSKVHGMLSVCKMCAMSNVVS
uniref:Fe2OG dioxygenase domain-containing protein n=1 Tax=Kalanchoe fedtschenkoi TaxID=63787 RepID=A0A7N0T8G5_KALFE